MPDRLLSKRLVARVAVIVSFTVLAVGTAAGPVRGLERPAEQPPSASSRPAQRAPALLLLHGGGFIFGDGGLMATAADRAERIGFKSVVVEYPLGDLPAAVRKTRAVARRLGRRGRDVYAYGESAGGTLAALLAQRGLAEATATYSPVADLTDFIAHNDHPDQYQAGIQASDRQLRRHSPGLHESRRRILVMTARREARYLARASRRWAQRDAQVRNVAVGGGHLGDIERPAVYRRNLGRALGWLGRQATASRTPVSQR